MLVGTEDANSPIYGLDYVPLDFIRADKTNLTYDVCVGCNHWLVSRESGKHVQHFAGYLNKIVQ